jgi:hypothetical protein
MLQRLLAEVLLLPCLHGGVLQQQCLGAERAVLVRCAVQVVPDKIGGQSSSYNDFVCSLPDNQCRYAGEPTLLCILLLRSAACIVGRKCLFACVVSVCAACAG